LAACFVPQNSFELILFSPFRPRNFTYFPVLGTQQRMENGTLHNGLFNGLPSSVVHDGIADNRIKRLNEKERAGKGG